MRQTTDIDRAKQLEHALVKRESAIAGHRKVLRNFHGPGESEPSIVALARLDSEVRVIKVSLALLSAEAEERKTA